MTPLTTTTDETEIAPQDLYTRGLEPDTILPDQFLRGSERSLSGEQRLMLAVLLDAMHIYTQPVAEWQHEKRRLFIETRRWIESTDRVWPFSFERLCEALDVDPNKLRIAVRARRRAAMARSEPISRMEIPFCAPGVSAMRATSRARTISGVTVCAGRVSGVTTMLKSVAISVLFMVQWWRESCSLRNVLQ
jgi:hypothetical protein